MVINTVPYCRRRGMADGETRHLTPARAMRSFWAMARPRTDTLSAGDWARAALEMLAQRGIEAVAVEVLAQRLRVTKGSFYWHFRSRAALLEAALREWETSATRARGAGTARWPGARRGAGACGLGAGGGPGRGGARARRAGRRGGPAPPPRARRPSPGRPPPPPRPPPRRPPPPPPPPPGAPP